MLNDLRFAIRMIAKHPWFSAAVIVTLALSIGVNTTVFTLTNAALFKPVPLPGGRSLVVVKEQDPKDPGNWNGVSLPRLREYRRENHSFTSIEAFADEQAIIGNSDRPPERYRMGVISPGLFRMLGIGPVLGRIFSEADGQPGNPPIALVGYGLWQDRFGGSPDVIGRVIHLNGKSTTIVGVMPEGFKFPTIQEVWMPLVPTKELEERSDGSLLLFGRLAPGSDIASARRDLAAISARMARAFPETDKNVTALVQSFQDAYNGGPIRLIFLLMLGAVGFLLLIACANVANMMLSRAQARSREIAVRAAIGASRWRVVRLLLVESVLLSVLGGALGLLVSRAGVHAFDVATQDVGKPYWIVFTMDWRAFTYFAAISVLTGLVFGLVPALRASRADLNTVLKDGGSSGTRRDSRLSGVLVVFQFALTVVLLAGAGVLVRSFVSAQRANPFVPAAQLLTARLSLPDGKGEPYESVDSRRRMHDAVLAGLSALPGVDVAALASDLPGLGSQVRDIEIDGHPNPDPKRPPRAAAVFATSNYLSAIGLPLLSGRALGERDGYEGREATVVTRAFAERFWPGESPIGRRVRFIADAKPTQWITVVGVCADIVQDTVDRSRPPVAYFSNRQEPWAWLGLVIRAHGDPKELTASIRKAIQAIDPELALFDVQTLPAALGHQQWYLKVFGTLFSLFAVIALLMACVGIYAVVAQTTSRRTREIGIRMALGSSAAAVVRLVLSRGLLQLGIGIGVGTVCAVAATRLMASIPGLSSTEDPMTFGLVALLLLGVGFLACWLPARRAARVAPIEALRTD